MTEVETISDELKSALAAIKVKFAGTWKETKQENVDGFFKEMGVNYFVRKLITKFQLQVDIEVDEDHNVIKIWNKVPGRNDEHILKLNEETEMANPNGKFKSTTTYENDKLVCKLQPSPGTTGKPLAMTREITSEGMLLLTLEVNSVVCKRFFNKTT